jgi:hypothetical protein
MSIHQWAKEAPIVLSRFNESFVMRQSSRNIDFLIPNTESIITARWSPGWLGSVHKIEILKGSKTIANISLPFLPSGTAQIQFLTGNTPEIISIKPLGFINIDKWFVYDSVPYLLHDKGLYFV